MKRLSIYIFNIIKMILILLSYLTPRIKNKWVFGSNMGYSNNSKYLFLYILKKRPEIDAIWITDSKHTSQLLRSKGLKTYNRYSLMGLFHAYTAKVFCYNSYAGDINVYASLGAIKVNLWHGVGIKKIEFLINDGPLASIFTTNSISNKLKYLNHYIRPDLFLSTSAFMSSHFKKSFRIDDSSIIESVYPRCEIFKYSKCDLRKFIKENETYETLMIVEKLELYDKVYIYMPTWRDGSSCFLEDSNFNIVRLNEFLISTNSCFLFKLHPSTKVSAFTQVGMDNILMVNSSLDIYPILPFTDVLITDYSSIYYDYLLLPQKEAIVYAFDFIDYTSKCRDLIMPFINGVGSNVVYSFDELMIHLENNNSVPNNKEEKLIQLFWADSQEKSIEDLIVDIENIVY